MNARPATPRYGWIFAAVLLAYLNALPAAFQFDDYKVIVNNPAVHGFAAWAEGMPGIRPLLKLSYALNWEIATGPFGFHAVNVLLHLANVALVWRLTAWFPLTSPPLSKGGQGAPHTQVQVGVPLTSPPFLKGGQGGFEGVEYARLITTLLFALHPIQTEAVTYITGRSISLMSLFGLGALLCWLAAPTRARPALWRAAALALFAAAVAVKEVAVALPLALLLLDRRLRASPALVAGLLLGLLALLWGLGYAYLLHETPYRSLLANLASETNALFWLAGQLLQPWALNIDPDLPEYASFMGLPGLQAALLATALALAWRERVRRPWLGFGLLWTLLLLAPMYSLVPRLDLASERHLYLAGLGLYWIIGAAMASLPLDSPRQAGLIVGLTLAGVLLTTQRNQDYRDEVNLWRATVQRSPNKDRAWNNLGYACALAGRADEARDAFLHTLRLNPQHPRAAANLRALERGDFGNRPAR
ncbi:MAG: hypothetical protein HZB71_14760 [Betaproteobacteria bacterium]|nr:hypothetical protein [Betaproteobacteria bacterium]